MKTKHRFKADSSPGDVMDWFQIFLWEYFVDESDHPDPAEYDCWLNKNISVTVNIKPTH